ncbi:spore germination protein [Paenibacillus sp. J5C_2022]|uniref:GerAB/ArcD/ProY family transporter n=1 Tax=Paenibacillus sp. J5C2022 TaxID=2977129 RepID=UPI0021D23418|nr:spore germination protein [Paenibacillus sp. J5C2022]MCU6708760.1 spore germination protein [Paenibacillus sp. J5C2022]
MKQQEYISSIQMSRIFLFFLTGSSIVIIPSPLTHIAGNGAWISLLISLMLGMLLLACMMYLYRIYPGMSFIEYSRAALGKWITLLLLIPFVTVMFWHVAGIVIEIGYFFKSTMLKETPTYAVNALFFIMIALTARAGIEVMARMAAFLLLLMFGFVILVLVLVSNLYHFEYLLPVMPDGIRPILHASYISYGFPYAELVVFAMILPYVRKQDTYKVRKHLFAALVVNGLIIMLSIIGSILVLGPLAGDLKYSLYQLARLIYIQEILERIESVIGFSLIVGFYFKTAILLLILMRVLAELLKLRNDKLLTFPVAFICFMLSVTTYTEEVKMEQLVNVIWPFLNSFVYVLPMLLIAAVTFIKRCLK